MIGMPATRSMTLDYSDYTGTYRHELPADTSRTAPQRLADIDSTEARGSRGARRGGRSRTSSKEGDI